MLAIRAISHYLLIDSYHARHDASSLLVYRVKAQSALFSTSIIELIMRIPSIAIPLTDLDIIRRHDCHTLYNINIGTLPPIYICHEQ